MVAPNTIEGVNPLTAPRLRYRDGYVNDRPTSGTLELRPWIKLLQRTLNGVIGIGGGLETDGLFGPATDQAVESLQSMAGIAVDGIVGPNTWRALLLATGAEPDPDRDFEPLYPVSRRHGAATVARMIEAFEPYRKAAERVASETGVSLALIFGIGARETLWGTSIYLRPPGPAGRGDHGHGHGLLQIDDRYHSRFIRSGKWSDPYENLRYGIAEVWLPSRIYIARKHSLDELSLDRAATAAYNCGPGRVVRALSAGRDVDAFTTGRDYSRDVFSWAGEFQAAERGRV